MLTIEPPRAFVHCSKSQPDFFKEAFETPHITVFIIIADIGVIAQCAVGCNVQIVEHSFPHRYRSCRTTYIGAIAPLCDKKLRTKTFKKSIAHCAVTPMLTVVLYLLPYFEVRLDLSICKNINVLARFVRYYCRRTGTTHGGSPGYERFQWHGAYSPFLGWSTAGREPLRGQGCGGRHQSRLSDVQEDVSGVDRPTQILANRPCG